ncbi:MAG TPA: DegT/DnrJ/EryC1/StrS family aminotransferase [Gaiellaceae bacterium]|nr:DegT/DnrJ/EryC1/StrS family aminotransferase [Gaiellaceae bacterium]
MSQIPLVDVKSQYAPLIPELERRFREVLESGQFIRGSNYWAFQEEAAAYLGVSKAVGVANGTDAIVIVLDAMEIGPGDEVICPAFTFYATAESIARRGATPVFADIDPATLNLDPEDVAAKVTPRTRAIMPVHLFGRPAPMSELAQLGVPLIEDAAQAFGAPGVATVGAVATYSFFPTKNLFCLGDGGLVATSDVELGERVQMLSFHGSRDKTTFDFVGYNSRLDEVQAAMLRLFLTHLDEWNRGRRAAAARYAELGLGELVELPQDESGHIYHLFVCRSPERDRIRAALTEAGIASAVYYTTPLHLQPALRFLGNEPGSLPETERVAEENFSLPLWPGIPVETQEQVVDVVRSAVGAVLPRA